jgi:hypothetical protein
MAYGTQNYWNSGLCPSSEILNNKKKRMPPSVMLHRAALVRTEGSEKYIASIIG